MTLHCSISSIDQVVSAFVTCEGVEQGSDTFPRCLVGPFCRFAHQVLEFGEDLLDGIEIWAVWREEQELGSCATDRLSDGWPFVAAQIVHDDDVAGRERRHKEPLDILCEALPVDRLVEHARSIDPVATERRKEGHRAPMTVGHFGVEPLTDRRPTTQRRHVGLCPGFVDEDEASRIKSTLILLPPFAPPRDGRPQLFGGQYAFF